MASDVYLICVTLLICIQNSIPLTKLSFVRQKWDVSLLGDKTHVLWDKLEFVQTNWLLMNKKEFSWTKVDFVEQTSILLYKNVNFVAQKLILVNKS